MVLTSDRLKLASILFVFVYALPCVQGYPSTESPNFMQFSTSAYQEPETFCRSPQYFGLGTRAEFHCSFPQTGFGVYWYNASDLSESKPLPLIFLKNTEKGGHGYESREYDIKDDGSLIINTVTFKHDGNFTAIVMQGEEYSSDSFRVIVTVKPYQEYPHIEGCTKDEEVCFRRVNGLFELMCSVHDTKPDVRLEWRKKVGSHDDVLKSESNVSLNNFLYTTRVKITNITVGSKIVEIFVCKGVSLPPLLNNDESIIMIKGAMHNETNVAVVTKYVQYATPYSLNCTDQDVLYIVWQKQQSNGNFRDVLDVLFTNRTAVTKNYETEVNVGNKGSLRINKANEAGLYVCVYGDGTSENIRKFDVQVYELSDSAYPFVEGCSHLHRCSVPVFREDKITCVIQGVSPTVQLKFEPANASLKHVVTFYNNSRKVTQNGFIYEISLTSRFRIHEDKALIAINCTASDNSDDSSVSTRIYMTLLYGSPVTIKTDQQTETETPVPNTTNTANIILIVACVVILVIFLTAGAVAITLYWMKRGRNNQSPTQDEEVPLTWISEEKISKFKSELEMMYKRKCAGIRPVPYNKDLKYHISQIYVESSMEQLEKVERQETAERGSYRNVEVWKKMESHYQILDETYNANARVIVEGDPGYGKTTLGYQLAYDWYTKDSRSPLKKVEIFIFLRLRHLKDISSVPVAVKRFILPNDSVLTLNEISYMLRNCGSVVLFLDGFDRYPDQNDDMNLVRTILMENELSNSQVIVTTRPSCLPVKYTETAVRIRVTGFDQQMQETYMNNAGSDNVVKTSVTKALKENSVLRDVCQVPLFFTLLANIAQDRTFFEESRIKTVTDFVSVLMECFHAEMNTFKDTKHSRLGRICFNAVCGNTKELLWTKDKLRKALGTALYSEYYRVGIFIEEDDLYQQDMTRKQSNKSTHRYVTRVRFFHNIFCEWYAAVELAKVISESKRYECLNGINAFDHQYVLRFACGMEAVSESIVNYVRNARKDDKLLILCYVERDLGNISLDKNLEAMFSSPVTITEHDTSLLQRSTIQLLELAATHKVDIECLWLGGMNPSVDMSNECLKLSSQHVLPKLPTLMQLSIREPGREFTANDVEDLLAYANLCSSLKSLSFRACIMPFCLKPEHATEKDFEGGKRVSVEWKCPNGGDWYAFDFQSRQWKCDGKVLTKTKYDEIKESINARPNVSVPEDDFSAGAMASASPDDITEAMV